VNLPGSWSHITDGASSIITDNETSEGFSCGRPQFAIAEMTCTRLGAKACFLFEHTHKRMLDFGAVMCHVKNVHAAKHGRELIGLILKRAATYICCNSCLKFLCVFKTVSEILRCHRTAAAGLEDTVLFPLFTATFSVSKKKVSVH